MLELDRWALMHMQLLKKEVSAAYESYDFHVLYHAIHNFCSIEMSSYYLDILKDRLYAYKPIPLNAAALRLQCTRSCWIWS